LPIFRDFSRQQQDQETYVDFMKGVLVVGGAVFFPFQQPIRNMQTAENNLNKKFTPNRHLPEVICGSDG
jgi:hypothetical protein